MSSTTCTIYPNTYRTPNPPPSPAQGTYIGNMDGKQTMGAMMGIAMTLAIGLPTVSVLGLLALAFMYDMQRDWQDWRQWAQARQSGHTSLDSLI